MEIAPHLINVTASHAHEVNQAVGLELEHRVERSARLGHLGELESLRVVQVEHVQPVDTETLDAFNE